MNLTVGNDIALAFGLLFARTGGVIVALPSLLGVALPVRMRVLLAAVIAASMMPLATVAMPTGGGLVPIFIMVLRELLVGLTLSFAVSVVVGAVMTAGAVVGGSMELNSGAILRADVESPNVLSDSLGALAAMLFFVGGFHRMLIAALAKSLAAFPLGAMPMPDLTLMLKLGERLFALALGLAFPVIVPLFVLSIAQGVMARLSPQVNILNAAPAAVVLAGLTLLALDASGIAGGIMRMWTAVMSQSMGTLNG